MADNKKKRGGADRARIAIKQSHEVRSWSEKIQMHAARAEGGGEGGGKFLEKGRRLYQDEEG